MNKPVLVYQAPLLTTSGYGFHASDVFESIYKNLHERYDIKVVSTPWGACPIKEPDNSERGQNIKKCLLTQNLTQQPEVFIQMSVCEEFKPIGKYNIGITAGVETTQMPPEWVDPCNAFNLIIVPSEHSKNVMVNTSYTKMMNNQPVGQLKINTPIEVLFEGVETNTYKEVSKSELDDDIKKHLSTIPTDFNFLFVGHWIAGDLGQDRKDVGMLIKTFCEVFKNKKNAPGLILKTSSATFSHLDAETIRDKVDSIFSTFKPEDKLPNVYLLHGDLTDDQMNSLYNHPKVKSMVSFTKGEGYGRPLCEMTFVGKPVIASGWSGHVDFLDKDLSILLPGKLTQVHPSAANKWLRKESQWFTANYSIAAQSMEKMFNEYSSYQEKAKKLMNININKFSMEKMHDGFIDIFDKYIPQTTKMKEIKLPDFIK